MSRPPSEPPGLAMVRDIRRLYTLNVASHALVKQRLDEAIAALSEPTEPPAPSLEDDVRAIARSERVLRAAILDVITTPPHCDGDAIGYRLRRALNESREPHEHPEDRCEECRELFECWDATPEDWETVTSRNWGGPILCKPCFTERLRARLGAGGGKP